MWSHLSVLHCVGAVNSEFKLSPIVVYLYHFVFGGFEVACTRSIRRKRSPLKSRPFYRTGDIAQDVGGSVGGIQ